MFFFCCVIFTFDWASNILAFGKILPICEALGLLCGLSDVTRASVDTVMRSKWVRFQFRVNYLFQTE